MDFERARAELATARLMLIFTPAACGERDPLAVLAACLDEIDVVQVRVKEPGRTSGPSPARELVAWTACVLRLVSERRRPVPVIVNDRVDVAASLRAAGCAGVHVGADDTPVEVARDVLGPEPLIGLSTHSAADVARACELPLDYLGFGPIHATPTRGYERGSGPEAAWVAASGATLPLFCIGGIDGTNAEELATVGRVAVGSAILGAPDPARAARDVRAALETPPDALS